MKNMTKGFILNLIACVFTLIGLVVYAFVMYKLPIVFVALAVSIVLTIAAFFQHKNEKHNLLTELVAGCTAFLSAGAIVGAVALMVNQIGYVIAALDTVDTIITFIIFEVIMFVAMILNLIASFMPVENEKCAE